MTRLSFSLSRAASAKALLVMSLVAPGLIPGFVQGFTPGFAQAETRSNSPPAIKDLIQAGGYSGADFPVAQIKDTRLRGCVRLYQQQEEIYAGLRPEPYKNPAKTREHRAIATAFLDAGCLGFVDPSLRDGVRRHVLSLRRD